MASVEDTTEVVCSRGVRLVADALISDLPSTAGYDAIALPVRHGMPLTSACDGMTKVH